MGENEYEVNVYSDDRSYLYRVWSRSPDGASAQAKQLAREEGATGITGARVSRV